MIRAAAPSMIAAMVPLARRNLFTERGRLAISVAGVAFAVLLVVTILGLYRGWEGAGGVFRDLPGDLWVAQAGTRDPFRSSSALPAGLEDELAGIPGVAAATPVLARRIAFGEGRDLDAFFVAFGSGADASSPAPGAAAFAPPPGGVVLESSVARDAGVRAGDELEVLGRTLRVERVRPGGNPLFGVAFLNARDAREILGLDDDVGFYLLTLVPGADAAGVAAAAAAAVPGAQVSTSAQFAQSTADLVRKGFLPVVGVLVALGVVIGGAVTALTTYTATVERSRDYGVLKAIGATRWFVARVVIQQSLIVTSLGAVLGLAATLAAVALIERRVPEFITELRALDVALVLAATFAVSLLAAYLPVRRINAIDPAVVFRA
jgi:putative ABC transport system permease protein